MDDVGATVEKLLSMGAKEYLPITPRGDSGFVTAAVVDPFGKFSASCTTRTIWRSCTRGSRCLRCEAALEAADDVGEQFGECVVEPRPGAGRRHHPYPTLGGGGLRLENDRSTSLDRITRRAHSQRRSGQGGSRRDRVPYRVHSRTSPPSPPHSYPSQ